MKHRQLIADIQPLTTPQTRRSRSITNRLRSIVIPVKNQRSGIIADPEEFLSRLKQHKY